MDIDRLSQVIARISDLAKDSAPALDTLEVNPLRIEGADVEVPALVWNGGQL